MLADLKPTILASDLGQGGQAGCVCHKLNASRSHRQTRNEQGLPPRRPGPGTPLPLDNPDCLPPYYMKLVNPIEASLEPSAISPWGAKWRDVDIGIYKPLVWCDTHRLASPLQTTRPHTHASRYAPACFTMPLVIRGKSARPGRRRVVGPGEQGKEKLASPGVDLVVPKATNSGYPVTISPRLRA